MGKPTRKDRAIAEFQTAYDKAVGKGGTVTDVWADVGRFGGVAIWVEVDEADRGRVFYSPYYNQSPDEDEVESVERNAVAWLDGMLGATNWDDWNWGDGEYDIPDF